MAYLLLKIIQISKKIDTYGDQINTTKVTLGKHFSFRYFCEKKWMLKRPQNVPSSTLDFWNAYFLNQIGN